MDTLQRNQVRNKSLSTGFFFIHRVLFLTLFAGVLCFVTQYLVSFLGLQPY